MVPKTCSVDGCESGGYLTRGWCKMHYARWMRHGETGAAAKQHSTSWAGETCKQDQCSAPVKSIGYCTAHYKRFRRWGDPAIKRPAIPAEERFWSKVDNRGPSECWPWMAAVGAHGYGTFHPSKKDQVLAHRFAYELANGAIPEGLHIDHLCRVRYCVNPGHLEAVTPLENSSRGLTYRLLNGMDDRCRNGHLYTPENTYVEPNGYKVRCRQCARDRDAYRRPQLRQKAA